jgi:hypothetical protein
MQRVVIHDPVCLEEFRAAARGLIADKVPPQEVMWTTSAQDALFESGKPFAEKVCFQCRPRMWRSPKT